MTQRIPKRIIQTGPDRSSISPEEQSCINSVLEHNAGFEYIFLGDPDVDAFIADEFPQLRSMLDGFESNIQKFDLFRYLAVYRMGGFYFDLDVELDAALDPLLDSYAVFPFEKLTIFPWLTKRRMYWQLGNYAFGATAGNPFLGALVNGCEQWLMRPQANGIPWWLPGRLKRKLRVYYSTGPGLVSRTFLDEVDMRTQVSVLIPKNARQSQTFGRFGRHHCLGSWKSRNGTVASWWLQSQNRRVAKRYGGLDPAELVEDLGGSPTSQSQS